MLLSSLLLVVAFSGCKKKDDTTSNFLNGEIIVPVDRYVEPGYTKSFSIDSLIRTIERRDGTKDVGYYFILPMSERDTLRREHEDWMKKDFTLVAPDSLDTFNLSVVAFAKEYYETSGLGTFTVVKPGLNGDRTSLKGYDITEDDPVFTDARDGREYLYSEIDGLQWMRQNLSWEGSGISYEKSSSPGVATVFGRFYNWEEAQTACPEGWRLPSDADWVALGNKYDAAAVEGKDINGVAGHLMENVYFNDKKMWEYWPDVKIDNAARLSILPFGYAMVDEDSFLFKGMGEYAAFWTSDENEGLGVYRYIFDEKNKIYYGAADKQYFIAPVRCVRDVPTL